LTDEDFETEQVSRLALTVLKSLPNNHPRMGEVYIRWAEVMEILEVSNDEIKIVYHVRF
jgi:hypothetical protein